MKRYLIALALPLVVIASVATAQPSTEDSTTTMTFQDFKPRYQYRKDRWHAVKVRLCRSHAAPHRWPSASEVAPRWRDNRLNRLHRRIAYALARGSACSVVPAWITDAFLCIKSYEGAWTSNTGNGYWGGLQMDMSFQATYGGEFLSRYGTADNWSPSTQILVGYRAWKTRGFYPWPTTARMCGLI